MQKVLNNHIRSEALKLNQLHQNQYAYQAGKSTVMALSSLVARFENTFINKEIVLCAVLDIEGAFVNTSYESIWRAARNEGVELPSIRWICTMLKQRIITAKLGDD